MYDPAITPAAHQCFSAGGTSYLRAFGKPGECYAVMYQAPPVNRGDGHTSFGLIMPMLLVTDYLQDQLAIAERVAAILNKHWDTYDQPDPDAPFLTSEYVTWLQREMIKLQGELFAAREQVRALLTIARETVALYGKPGGPWSVPSDPGGWLNRMRDAIDAASQAICTPSATADEPIPPLPIIEGNTPEAEAAFLAMAVRP
jgi:hypothetical protein